MTRRIMVYILSIFLRILYFMKCLVNKLSGGSIKIGPRTSIHPSVKLSTGGGEIVIGNNCIIHKGAILAAYGGKIALGDNVSINPYTILYGHGGLEIGNDVRIATHTVIIPAEHIFEKRDKTIDEQGLTTKGIIIGDDVWIAAGAKILDGAIISTGCVIGANTVVKEKTEPYGIYVGMPARKVGERR